MLLVDLNYYESRHMPMVAGFLGKNLKFYEIDKGIAGRTPPDKIPYLAVGYFYVTDVAEYNKAKGQNREAIIGDFKNYTNIQPVIQTREQLCCFLVFSCQVVVYDALIG